MHTVTIKSKRPMVVLPLDEYESMRETIELLAVNPNLPQQLKEERRKMDQGEFINWEDFKRKHKVR